MVGADIAGAQMLLELGFIILISTILGLFAAYLKQPLIPVYILVGLLMNYLSTTFGLFPETTIKEIAELGIAFLLFLVGMEFDLERIREIFGLAVFGTIIQVFLTSSLFFALFYAFGVGIEEALITSLALSFSSTAIVVKYLSDKGLIDTIHGRSALGMLLMQDIIVVLAIPFMIPYGDIPFMYHMLDVVVKGSGLVALAFIFNKFMVKPLLKKFYNNVDISFLLSLSIMFIFSIISVVFGFSIAIGGFLGGLAMAVYPYSYRVISRISHLRDFFIVLFFVALGLQVSLSSLTYREVILGGMVILLTLILKPLIYMVLSSLFGNDAKNSLQLGLNMAQTSEFSLIMTGIALGYGLVSDSIYSMVAFVFFITSFISSYLLQWSNIISSRLYRYFEFMEKLALINKEEIEEEKEIATMREVKRNHVIIYGINALTKLLIEKLDTKKVVVFDDDLTQVRILRRQGYNVLFGNPEDEEILKYMHVDKASVFMCMKDNFEEIAEMMTTIKSFNKTIKFIARAKTFKEALKLYEGGADYVFIDGFRDYEFLRRIVYLVLSHETDAFEEIRKKEMKILTREAEKEILALHIPKDLQAIKEAINR